MSALNKYSWFSCWVNLREFVWIQRDDFEFGEKVHLPKSLEEVSEWLKPTNQEKNKIKPIQTVKKVEESLVESSNKVQLALCWRDPDIFFSFDTTPFTTIPL